MNSTRYNATILILYDVPGLILDWPYYNPTGMLLEYQHKL